jgi:hypothetical protein
MAKHGAAWADDELLAGAARVGQITRGACWQAISRRLDPGSLRNILHWLQWHDAQASLPGDQGMYRAVMIAQVPVTAGVCDFVDAYPVCCSCYVLDAGLQLAVHLLCASAS